MDIKPPPFDDQVYTLAKLRPKPEPATDRIRVDVFHEKSYASFQHFREN
jgi:hypothetical protein